VIDGPFADYRNDDGLRQSCRTARALGYDGKWAIHPAQIEIINQMFAPTAEEVLWARQVIASYEAAMTAGSGAMTMDGMMVDAATLRMARATLARIPHASAAR
jgi:citrate lyase subunit beta/citryl-CoA lyase